MTAILSTLLLVAPQWVREYLTKEKQPNVFWSEYIVWPLIQIIVVLFIILTLVAYLVYLERKVSAFMQARLGPMRVGPWGLLQPAADGLKLLLKEDIIPIKADKAIFQLAPIIAVVAALVVLAVVPWGAGWGTIANVNIGLLFILAVSSVAVLGLVLAGWSSNSKYSLLGALRSSAQMLSYEIGMGLSIIGALMFARTLSMNGIVEAQRADGVWYFFFQPLGFLVYVICALGETNRAPFDLPEAESELVAGYHTEYSGFRWALFFMAEYTAMIVTSSIAVTLYLGGWSFPGLSLIEKSSPNLFVFLSIVIFATKVMVLIYAFMWIRWTWPRYRYDQLMEIGWKWMIPAGLANIVMTAIWYVLALPSTKASLPDFLKFFLRFNFMKDVSGRLVPTQWAGVIYFVATGFLITVPMVWALLAAINRRSNDFNLDEQRQLQFKLRRERLKKMENAEAAE
ncbi:MAG: NADH-quinone oxidoreductase subunit NuoH [Acidobacteria bacterium]|nr:NADH-quinone oxidoreductase subunit NuoH [Acidobacteriota bacterium]